MSFIPEETKKEAELRKKVEASFEKDPTAPKSLKSRETRKIETSKEKEARARKDYEQKQKTLEYKRERLEWQKERSKIKDKLRREAEEKRKKRGTDTNVKTEPIGEKDRDPSAYKKAIGGVASFTKSALKVGSRAVINAAKNRRKKKEADKIAAERKTSGGLKFRHNLEGELKKKFLPGTKIKGSLKPAKVKGFLSPSTIGQTARKDPQFKKREIEKRGGTVSEDFSCWREEFLYELGKMRKDNKKSKKDGEDYIVDVMPKNKKNLVTIGPNIKENFIAEENHKKISYDLVKTIMKKLVDEKKRKNYLLNYGYIGESKYDKSNLKCNSPKSDPVGSGETGKSHVVKACKGGTEKLIRFGQRGVKGSPKKEGESEAYRNRRKRFKARHAKNISKGKMSAAYWANLWKW